MTTSFEELQLIPQLARAVRDEGYVQPTPIQVSAIPHVLAGRDLLGLAQTGTGKTAAFALPILQRLAQSGRRPHGDRPIAVLVLTPTRELASQIGESFAQYGKHLGFRQTVIFGGVGQTPQERALRAGIDILIATPGRLLDLASQRKIHLAHVEIFVLDEADRMLDMGFVHDVRRVVALLPSQRQTLFFSATMPPEAKRLADGLLRDPATVAVTPVSSTVDTVQQSVYLVDKADKRQLLRHVLDDAAIRRALVFTRTKHAANRVAEFLERAGVAADAIHGNKSQNARERALLRFKKGESRVLVATDIAARGIDIDDITHVVNFDLPNVPETYVHRVGRTGRAGASGIALSFCDDEEREYLADIERLIRRTVARVEDHPHLPSWSALAFTPSAASRPAPQRSSSSSSSRSPQRSSSPRPGQPSHAQPHHAPRSPQGPSVQTRYSPPPSRSAQPASVQARYSPPPARSPQPGHGQPRAAQPAASRPAPATGNRAAHDGGGERAAGAGRHRGRGRGPRR